MNKYCITTELLHFYFEMLQFFCIFVTCSEKCVLIFFKSLYILLRGWGFVPHNG
jgi:hypothetical protein